MLTLKEKKIILYALNFLQSNLEDIKADEEESEDNSPNEKDLKNLAIKFEDQINF